MLEKIILKSISEFWQYLGVEKSRCIFKKLQIE